jgi:hypothetical protein
MEKRSRAAAELYGCLADLNSRDGRQVSKTARSDKPLLVELGGQVS